MGGQQVQVLYTLEMVDGAVVEIGTGTGTKIATSTAQKLGFYNATPVIRQTAITQTYTTATGTHSNLTSATLTDSSTGTASGTIGALGTAGTATIPVAYNDAIASLAAQCNALRVDLANTKQVLNQAIDHLQTYGILG